MSRLAIFRVAAVFLLLLTAWEVLSCEINSFGCEDFAASQTSGGGDSPDDSCVCCCRHVVVVRPGPMMVAFGVVAEVTPLEASKPEIPSFPVYHPPQA